MGSLVILDRFGNGDLEITITNVNDFERSKNLIVKSNEENWDKSIILAYLVNFIHDKL